MQLPTFIASPAIALIGQQCYTTLVEDFNITNVPCLKLAVSKALGIGIVVGGSIVKVPQIIKIVAAHSAQGLSLTSFLLEFYASLVSITYNVRKEHPFSTWGETLFITVQNAVIIGLMFAYASRWSESGATAVATVAFLYAILNPAFVSMEQLAYMQAGVIPIFLASKVPQILTNYTNSSTGQLSAFTVFNYFFGSLARVFTTIQEVNDSIILLGFVLTTVLNAVLALQMVYYWNNTDTKQVVVDAAAPETPETPRRSMRRRKTAK